MFFVSFVVSKRKRLPVSCYAGSTTSQLVSNVLS